jgi:hypothetical protein
MRLPQLEPKDAHKNTKLMTFAARKLSAGRGPIPEPYVCDWLAEGVGTPYPSVFIVSKPILDRGRDAYGTPSVERTQAHEHIAKQSLYLAERAEQRARHDKPA